VTLDICKSAMYRSEGFNLGGVSLALSARLSETLRGLFELSYPKQRVNTTIGLVYVFQNVYVLECIAK